jgi:prefoldin subunit 5
VTAPAAEVVRLRRRLGELEAEIARLTAENRELTAAEQTSRNFKASVAAGHITLNLDNWGNQ